MLSLEKSSLRLATLILFTLRHLPGGLRQVVALRLLDVGQIDFDAAWGILTADNLVRLDDEQCKITNKGLISFGCLEKYLIDGQALAEQNGNDFGLAFHLLRQDRTLEAVKLLMGQAKRHAPRSAAAAAACLDIILKVLHDVTLEGSCDDSRRHYVNTVIELADISTYLPLNTREVCPFLERAAVAARRSGDNRSVAVLHLVHAHVLTFSSFNISPDADRLFNIGVELGESIGDADMIEYISTFLGFRHFLKGEFQEAEKQFCRVRCGFALPNSQYWWVVFHAMSSAFLGLDRQAIGSLESAYQSATLSDDLLSANFLRLHLALILIMAGKTKEALAHIDFLSEQIGSDSVPILQIRMKWILMYYHYRSGNLVSAHVMMEKISAIISSSGMPRPMHHFPWILEVLLAFRKHGMTESKHFNLAKELEWSITAPSRQINAAAWRIQGIMALDAEVPNRDEAMKALKNALRLYIKVGNPVEVARVKLDLAAIYALQGRELAASRLRAAAFMAHRLFGDPAWPQGVPKPRPAAGGTVLGTKKWFELPRDRFGTGSAGDREDILRRSLAIFCRKMRVEQAALFAIRDGGSDTLARFNLSILLMEAQDFLPYKTWVQRQTRPKGVTRRSGKLGCAMCIPLEISRSTVHLFLLNKYHEEEMSEGRTAKFKSEAEEFFRAVALPASANSQERPATKAISEPASPPQPDDRDFLTENEAMRQLLARLRQAAATEASIHIFGETGVGKELLARHVHRHSGRTGPFVCVHPASMTETLFESAFFGHEKGSFTGATTQKIGFFELANGGTLFIDEVGEMPLSTQAKFLRVLQERTFIRVGGLREIRSDFRLVTATNRKLEKEIEAGNFRMDLFYRIAVVPVLVPPLRLRGDDCELLAQTFLNHFTRKYRRPPITLEESQRRLIREYPWPGNVRELENVIERAVILHSGGRLELSLPLSETARNAPPAPPAAAGAESVPVPAGNDITAGWPSLEEIERRYIKLVLEHTRGQIDGDDGAAALLGIGRSTLYAKIRKFGFRQSRRYE